MMQCLVNYFADQKFSLFLYAPIFPSLCFMKGQKDNWEGTECSIVFVMLPVQ